MVLKANGSLARTAPRHLLAPHHRPSSAWRAELPVPRECPPRFRSKQTPPQPKASPSPSEAGASRRAAQRQAREEERARMRRDIALRKEGLLSGGGPDISLVTARERAEPTSASVDASATPASEEGASVEHEAPEAEPGASTEGQTPAAERDASSERVAPAAKRGKPKTARDIAKRATAAAAAIDRNLRAHDLSVGEEAWQSSQVAAREQKKKRRPPRAPPDATMAIVDGFLEGEVLGCFAPKAQARLNATSLAALLRDY